MGLLNLELSLTEIYLEQRRFSPAETSVAPSEICYALEAITCTAPPL